MPYNGDMEHCGPFQRTPSRRHLGLAQMIGEALLPFSYLLAPTKESTPQTLIQLRCDLGLSRGHMAALLGIRKDHLRHWEKGSRKPSRPAQKLIWLIHSMAHESHPIQDAFTLITWGRLKWKRGNTRVQEYKSSKHSEYPRKKGYRPNKQYM